MSTPIAERPQVSRPLLITLAVLVVLALGYLLFTMLGSSNEVASVERPDVAAAESEPAIPSVDPVEPTEGGSEIGAVEPTFEVFQARDPFEQLVADAADATVGTTQPTTTTTSIVDDTQPATTSIVDDTQPATTPPTTDTIGSDPAQTVVGATTILLEDVFTDGGVDKVVVVVDDEGYEAAENETVADDLTILDIEGSCATMRLDDVRFILCEGEQIQK